MDNVPFFYLFFLKDSFPLLKLCLQILFINALQLRWVSRDAVGNKKDGILIFFIWLQNFIFYVYIFVISVFFVISVPEKLTALETSLFLQPLPPVDFNR